MPELFANHDHQLAYRAGVAMGHVHCLALAEGDTDIPATEHERDVVGNLWLQDSLKSWGHFHAGYDDGFEAEQTTITEGF